MTWVSSKKAIRFGWRYQIAPWVEAGYRVVAPDMLGYGGTDKPKDTADYSPKKLSDDLAAILDLIDVQKAVSIHVIDHSELCLYLYRW